MINIQDKIELNKIGSSTYFKGSCFIDSKKLTTNEINLLFEKTKTLDSFKEKLVSLNGFFYIIVETTDSVFIATDRVRTMPLFYSINSKGIFLSENAWELSLLLDNVQENKLALKQFLHSGYVLGSNTLYKNISQVQAGECICIDKQNLKVIASDYFQLNYQYPLQDNSEELIEELDAVHMRVFKRLLKVVNGRTIVVPLSGGYDSRLIIAMLRRLKYENVICFSYGTKCLFDVNGWEQNLSKKVAMEYDYKWLFIEYSRKKWYDLANNEKSVAEYVRFVSRGVSLCTYQDWLAVSKMKKEKLIPDDSVFIPGHSGDFIEGSHIPSDFITNNEYNSFDKLTGVLKVKYANQFKDIENGNIISESLSSNIIDKNDFLLEMEHFCWRERQAKHICNSSRNYEFWGYDWYFPLWDKELVEYWYKVSFELRVNRRLYFDYVEAKIPSKYGYQSPKYYLIYRILNKMTLGNLYYLFDNYYGIVNGKYSLVNAVNLNIGNVFSGKLPNINTNVKIKKIGINGLGQLLFLKYLK